MALKLRTNPQHARSDIFDVCYARTAPEALAIILAPAMVKERRGSAREWCVEEWMNSHFLYSEGYKEPWPGVVK